MLFLLVMRVQSVHLRLLMRCQPCVLADSTAWLAPPSFQCFLQARKTCMKGFPCTTTTWHLHAPQLPSPLSNWCRRRRLQHTSRHQKRTRTRLPQSLRSDTHCLLPTMAPSAPPRARRPLSRLRLTLFIRLQRACSVVTCEALQTFCRKARVQKSRAQKGPVLVHKRSQQQARARRTLQAVHGALRGATCLQRAHAAPDLQQAQMPSAHRLRKPRAWAS